MSRFGSVMISRAKTEKIEELEKELSTELKQFETTKKQQGKFDFYEQLFKNDANLDCTWAKVIYVEFGSGQTTNSWKANSHFSVLVTSVWSNCFSWLTYIDDLP